MTPLDRPGWKTTLSWTASILLAVLFVISGLWKITDVHPAAARMAQLKVPESLSLAAALIVGIAETVAGVLVLVPRFRRWGAMLTGLLLLVFMVYIGAHYSALRGSDCSCFPWVERLVGPAFFIGDCLMLLLAVAAGAWARPPESLRSAVLVLGAVMVFALVSFGVVEARQSGRPAPDSITVSGQPYSLRNGKVFLFFFHPQCMHCLEAARKMAAASWGQTRVVAVPVEQPQYAGQFLAKSGLHAPISGDFQKLKNAFGYPGYPWGVAVENGREKAPVRKFDDNEPVATLRQLGFVE